MPRAAVALETPNPGAGARPPRSFRFRRVHLAVIGIAIVAVWLVLVFARALGDVDRATARQQGVAAAAATLQAQLDADKREQQIVQTDGFQRLQARAYGMGAPGEVVFTLPQDAPSPAPITPLGGSTGATSLPGGSGASADAPSRPLDAWLRLIFGN